MKKEYMLCPRCKLEVKLEANLRCPRCNSPLIQGCSGNCAGCIKTCNG